MDAQTREAILNSYRDACAAEAKAAQDREAPTSAERHLGRQLKAISDKVSLLEDDELREAACLIAELALHLFRSGHPSLEADRVRAWAHVLESCRRVLSDDGVPADQLKQVRAAQAFELQAYLESGLRATLMALVGTAALLAGSYDRDLRADYEQMLVQSAAMLYRVEVATSGDTNVDAVGWVAHRVRRHQLGPLHTPAFDAWVATRTTLSYDQMTGSPSPLAH